MFNAFNAALPILSVVLTICLAIGGFFAFRQGYGRTGLDIQEQLIHALKTQNELQGDQIESCEKEIARLKGGFTAIGIALKERYGLRIEMGRTTVSVIDEQARQTYTVEINMPPEKNQDEPRKDTNP